MFLSRREFAGLAFFKSLFGLRKYKKSTYKERKQMTYKALVMIELAGGNDSYNLLIPRSGAGYAEYSAARSVLAVPSGSILTINPVTGGDTRTWGVHPSAVGIQTLFEGARLSFISNVGTLLEPTTKAQYLAGTVEIPAQLFSHIDQSVLWQLPHAKNDTPFGWAGKALDALSAGPLGAISIVGTNRMQEGPQYGAYAVTTNGPVQIYGAWQSGHNGRMLAMQSLRDYSVSSSMFSRRMSEVREEAMALSNLVASALTNTTAPTTVFPSTSIGDQLKIVAHMIKARAFYGEDTQIYYVRQGGYDTHASQLVNHPALLGALSEALEAFDTALQEIGDPSVIYATWSEFGRTLTSNGNGSDHGWGGNQMVGGEPIRGRVMFGSYPSLALSGASDIGQGRMLPSTSTEQYFAGLCGWLGLNATQLNLIFDRLYLFPSGALNMF